MTEGKIMVEREPYEKDGKTFQSYFIRGTVRGVDFRVRIVPPDYGGYTVLDIVYAGEQEAELVLVPYEITDEKTGRVTKGNSYAVHSEDEDGTVYECKIIPFRKSDKDLLQMLLVNCQIKCNTQRDFVQINLAVCGSAKLS